MYNTKNLKPFKKGDDSRRNTKGRPKGTSDIRERVREAVNKKVWVNGEEMELETVLIMKLIKEALKGKISAFKLLTSYLYGKPDRICPVCEKTLRESSADYKREEKARQKKAVKDLERNQSKWFVDERIERRKEAQKLFEKWKRDYLKKEKDSK